MVVWSTEQITNTKHKKLPLNQKGAKVKQKIVRKILNSGSQRFKIELLKNLS